MLLCDGEPVNLKAPQKSGSASKFVNSKLKELENIGFPMRFNLPKELSNDVFAYNKRTEESRPTKEYAQGVRIKLTSNYQRGDGSLEKWTYYEDEKTSREGKHIKYMPRWYELKRVNTFTARDKELLFYLVYISGNCESIEGLTGQNKHKKKEFMILEDRAREARKVAKARRAQAMVSAFLYDQDKMSEEDIRILAKSYYIPDVDNTREVDILRDSIYNIVVKSNDSDAVEKFMKRTNLDELTKIQALITDCIDKKVIFLKDTIHGKSWRFLDPDARESDVLHEVSPSERPKRSLATKLMVSPDLVELMKKELNERASAKEFAEDE